MTLHPVRLIVIALAAAAFPALAADKAPADAHSKTAPAAAGTSLFESIVKTQVASGQQDTPELRNQVKLQLFSMALLAEEGKRVGLDKTTEVKNALELGYKQIMSQAMVTDFAKKNPIKDAEIKAEYEKYKLNAVNAKEYHARHILVEKEDTAKSIIAKLKSGAKFEDLAKQSLDTNTANTGGELQWALLQIYPKPFADALAGLQKGQLTESPVRTQAGYHVIRLDDLRPARIGTYEEIKPKISLALTEHKVQLFIEELATKAQAQLVK